MVDNNNDTVTLENGHTYPDKYAPGPKAPWHMNAAWEILDCIKPGVIPIDVRSMLAGQIAGRLIRAAAEGK